MPMVRPLQALLLLSILATVITASTGCRAIARHTQSHQSVVARRLSRQGLEAMHAERWEQAGELFAGALELSRTDDRALRGYAETLWHRGQREEAVRHMEEAASLSGDDPEVAVRLGRMYLELGRVEEARRQSDLALKTARNHPAAWALRGEVLTAEGEPDAALAALHRALAFQPDYPAVQVAIAELYARQGRYDRLLATLDRLQDRVADDGCPVQVHALRGLAMQRLGRPDEACRCYAAAAASGPDDPGLLCQWAEAELACGDAVAARMALGRALRIRPDHPHAQRIARSLQNELPRVAAEAPAAAEPRER